MVSAIVLAAGKGSRMKSDTAKQFIEIGGKPLLYYSLKVFDPCNTWQRHKLCEVGDCRKVRLP